MISYFLLRQLEMSVFAKRVAGVGGIMWHPSNCLNTPKFYLQHLNRTINIFRKLGGSRIGNEWWVA
jgi:hypothetical protein